MIAWLVAAACAHPFGARFAAHATTVDVQPERVVVTYLADVPNPLVATATHDRSADPVAAMAEELRTGLVLEIDGASVVLQPMEPFTVQPTDDTHQYAWQLEAPLQEAPHVVRFSNGNLPGVTAVFRGKVQVHEDLEIVENSLWRMKNGEVALDETDRWRTDERNRVLEVTLAPRRPAWLPWVVGGGLALAALVVSFPVALRARRRSAPAARSRPD